MTLLTQAEVCERLKITRQTLWRLRTEGQFAEPIRLGGSVRWKPEDIEAFLQGQRHED